jgi:mercuric ion binding protein
MKKTLLFGLAVLAIAGGGLALALGGSGTESSPVAGAAQAQTTFAIENMTCALCPITVKTAMEDVAGVTGVEIDFAAKTAQASYDARRTDAAAIAAASVNAGYPARAIGGV